MRVFFAFRWLVLAAMCAASGGCVQVAAMAIVAYNQSKITRPTERAYSIAAAPSDAYAGVLAVLSKYGAVEGSDATNKTVVALDPVREWEYTVSINEGATPSSSILDSKVVLVGKLNDGMVGSETTNDVETSFVSDLKAQLGVAVDPLSK